MHRAKPGIVSFCIRTAVLSNNSAKAKCALFLSKRALRREQADSNDYRRDSVNKRSEHPHESAGYHLIFQRRNTEQRRRCGISRIDNSITKCKKCS